MLSLTLGQTYWPRRKGAESRTLCSASPVLACRDGSMCASWQGWHQSVCGTGFSQHPAVWEAEGRRELINLPTPGCYGMWTCGFQGKDSESHTDTAVLGKMTVLSFDPQSLPGFPKHPCISMCCRAPVTLCLDAWMRNGGTWKAKCSLSWSMKEVLTLFPAKTGLQGSSGGIVLIPCFLTEERLPPLFLQVIMQKSGKETELPWIVPVVLFYALWDFTSVMACLIQTHILWLLTPWPCGNSLGLSHLLCSWEAPCSWVHVCSPPPRSFANQKACAGWQGCPWQI